MTNLAANYFMYEIVWLEGLDMTNSDVGCS